MIVNQEDSVPVLTNSNRASSFGLDASAEAFQILSSDIYEYKIAAVVRELCCNAWDSHLDAGHRKPIHLIFPNDLNPYFSVEDFGIGLDEDGIRSIFTTYFGSTKKNSEFSTGCLGLGSKSPLAYTDSFTIRSRKNGMEYNFVCYINESGIPDANMISANPTTESNGVKVTLPVRRRDFNDFINDARFICSLFEVTPTSNRQDFEVAIHEMYDTLDENGIFFPSDSWNGGSPLYNFSGGDSFGRTKTFVVMGNVAYRSESLLLTDDVPNDVKQFVHRFANRTTFMRVPMGSIKFAASRESLSLTDITRKTVTDIAIAHYRRMMAEYESKINNACDHIEAIRTCNDLTGTTFGQRVFSYNGKLISKIANTNIAGLIGRFGCAMYRKNYRTPTVSTTHFTNASGRLKYTNFSLNGVVERDPVIIYTREKNTGIVKYSREYAREHSDAIVFAFGNPMSERNLERIKKVMGHRCVAIAIEDLRKEDLERKKKERANLPKAERQKKSEDFMITAVPVTRHGTGRSIAFNTSASDETFAYVNRLDYIDLFEVGDTSYNELSLGEAIRIAENVLGEKITVLVANKSNRKKIERNNIISVESLFEKARDKFMQIEGIVEKISFSRAKSCIDHNIRMYVEALNQADSKEWNDDMKLIHDTMKYENDRRIGINNLHSVLKFVGDKVGDDIEAKLEQISDSVDNVRAMFFKEEKYPMFDSSKDLDTLIRYVKMEDAFSNSENS